MLRQSGKPHAPHKVMYVPPLCTEKEAMTIFEYWDPVNVLVNNSKIGLQHKKLCVAVLTMAVDDLNLKGFNYKAHTIRKQAKQWFASPDMTHPFSFLRICQYLDLDPGYFVKELKPMRKKVYRHIVRATKDAI
jgi:hypothetical protein